MAENTLINNQQSEKRNIGIDLLRLVSMFMVVLLHCMNHGLALGAVGQHPAMRMLWLMCICAVNCYALITGYVFVNARQRLSRLIGLWLQVAFCTLTIFIIARALGWGETGRLEFIKACLPVMSKTYWYFTAYFGLFLFIPTITQSVIQLGERKSCILFAEMFVLFSCVSSVGRFIGGGDFSMGGGYSMAWLAMLCFIGAYIKVYGFFDEAPRWVWLLVFVGSAAAMLLCEKGANAFLSKLSIYDILFNCVSAYNSPFVLLEAISLLKLFSGFKISHGAKIVKILSSAAFGIYIISENAYLRRKFVVGKFADVGDMPIAKAILAVLAGAALIYMFSMELELLRILLFKLLGIDKFCNFAGAGIRKIVRKVFKEKP